MVPVDLLNYHLIRMLGSGGMGEVYLARNKNIEQYVAVKALHPRYGNNPMLRAKFKQEAVMLNSLNHPNIVKFYNFVENEYGVFLIMEYVEGDTLEDFISKKNGLIVQEKAYPMFAEILSAFAYAHQHGIIHRDIKPSNIFLDKDGHIKVMDFGIAQIISEVNSMETGHVSMGTPAFMSPEQVFGQPLDQRSDIYSLGVLFHQMLTGRAPYDSTTMSDMEIKGRVVNESLPRMKNYYPYISDGMQKIVDKATAKKREDRYESCDAMAHDVKKVLNPDAKSRMPLYMALAAAAVCLIVGLGVWDYLRTKVEYYKDYAEFYGVAKGIGSLSSNEVSHRQSSYRIESSRWKTRRVTLINAKGKTINHFDTEHMNMRYADVYYYYRDNGMLDYKKAYDPYGKLLYKIDYDENMKVAMFKYDDEHGTAKRLKSNTTELYNLNESERSSITRYLLTYNEEGLLQKVEYASGEDNMRVGDSDNIYGQAYAYDEKGRIIEVRFLGQDGKVKSNKIGLAIKQYQYDDDDNWTQVTYLSATGKPSHDGNNCPLVKLENDKWGNRISEKYYTISGKPSVRKDLMACGMQYQFDDEGNNVLTRVVDGNDSLVICKNGYAQVKRTYNEHGFMVKAELLDKEGKRTNQRDDNGEVYSSIVNEVDARGLILSQAYYDDADQPHESSTGIHKVVWEYDSIGQVVKMDYQNKKLKPVKNGGFNAGVRYTYDEQGRTLSMSFYDEEGQLTYNNTGIAVCLYSHDKMGNTTRYEYRDKDGKHLVNCHEGQAVLEVTYDNLGNIQTVRNYNSQLKPCMTSYGFYAKEFVYDEKTNFNTQIKYYFANGSIKQIDKYTYDNSGNLTAKWTVNGNGTLIESVLHYEYDDHNNVTKHYATNLHGKRVNQSGVSYCEVKCLYDERGNITEQTYWDANGKPAIDAQKTHHRIKRYDERNNYIYEKNLGKDGKPIRGQSVNPEAKVTYDNYGNILVLACFDGYGKPYTSTDGYHRLERKYNEQNLLVSECYKDTRGNLAKHIQTGCAKGLYEYDSKRNRVKEKYFNERGKLLYYVTYKYNDQCSLTEACMYNGAGHLDDSRAGFSKLRIAYADDGVTPRKKTYYKGGTVLAWQSYDSKTGKWGNLNF